MWWHYVCDVEGGLMRYHSVMGNVCCLMMLSIESVLMVVQPALSYGLDDDRMVVNTPGDGFLALRSEPTIKSGRRLAKIPHGTALRLGVCQPTSDGNQWCQTTYNGVTGWVFGRYLLRIDSAPVKQATAAEDRPVMVGEDPEFDACPSIGVFSGLKPYNGPCKAGWVSRRYIQVIAD